MDPVKNKKTYFIYLLLVLWHFFMTSSMSLRFNANLFWPAMALIGLLLFGSRKNFRRLYRYDILLCLSIGIMILSFSWTSSLYSSYKYTFSIIVYYIVARSIIMYLDDYKYVINILYIFSILMAILTCIQILLPNVYYNYLISLLPHDYHDTIMNLEKQKAYTGFTIQTSMNALYMSIGIGIAYFKFMYSTKHRLLNIFLIFTLLIILINTNRRGALIVIIFLLIAMIYLSAKNKITGTLLIISFAILIAAIGIDRIPGLSNIIYKTSFYANSGDLLNGRLLLWDYAIQGFKEKPFLGNGINTYNVDTSAHNSYLQILYELGAIGIIFYFLPHAYVLVKSYKSIIGNKITIGNKPLMLLSLFIQLLFILTAFFEGIYQDEIMVFMLFIFQLIAIRILHINRLLTTEKI